MKSCLFSANWYFVGVISFSFEGHTRLHCMKGIQHKGLHERPYLSKEMKHRRNLDTVKDDHPSIFESPYVRLEENVLILSSIYS